MNNTRRQSPSNWQQQLSDTITDTATLLKALEITPAQAKRMGVDLNPGFPLKVPRSYLSRINKGQADDPLLRQVLALEHEHISVEGEAEDPVEDLQARRLAGLIHKYHGRVLLIVTAACAVHCRYCFRKNFPYKQNISGSNLSAIYDYLMQASEIDEVILSGGDPLSYSNKKLFALCERLEEIPHLNRIRIHTRLPIVLPARIDTELRAWLQSRPKHYVIVFHINHPNEIDDEVEAATAKLRHLCLLNQAVLLRGVNDQSAVLKRLSTRCFEVGVLPYYLHLLDPVSGTSHFKVSEKEALRIMKQLNAELPGYLVPKLVREYPGEASKTHIEAVGKVFHEP